MDILSYLASLIGGPQYAEAMPNPAASNPKGLLDQLTQRGASMGLDGTPIQRATMTMPNSTAPRFDSYDGDNMVADQSAPIQAPRVSQPSMFDSPVGSTLGYQTP